jgi:hypothetical protein
MRSRLPGKLRSSSWLLGAVIVKDRTRLAKRRLVMGGFIGQILRNTDQAPRQHEAKARTQQQSERDIHDIHRHWIFQVPL